MSERNFVAVRNEGTEINFVRASRLFEELEGGTRAAGDSVVEGTFLGTQPNPMNDQKEDFRIEREDGSLTIVNGAGNLGFKMKAITVGDYIQITYNGKQEIAKGPQKGRQAHNYDVLIAE